LTRPKGILVHPGRDELTEASLSRVYRHWLDSGFAALTSWRHLDRKTGEPIPTNVNKRRLAELQRAVRAAGFGYIPLDSVWREGGKSFAEPSILVPATRKLKERHTYAPDMHLDSDIGMLRELSLTLGKKYDQDSVLVVQPGGHGAILSTQPATFGQVEVNFTKFKPSDMNWIFSKLRGQRRAFFLESAPTSFSEAQLRLARGEIPRGSTPPITEAFDAERPPCSCANTDRKGNPLSIGDYVSQPTYPRGKMRGWIVYSKRALCGECMGRAFAVKDEMDGTVYNLSGKATKLRKQIPMGEGLSAM